MSAVDLEDVLAQARALPGVHRVLITLSPEGVMLPLYITPEVEELAAAIIARGKRQLLQSIEIEASA